MSVMSRAVCVAFPVQCLLWVVMLLTGCEKTVPLAANGITDAFCMDGPPKVTKVQSGLLPFDLASRAELSRSPRKVFAHYFPPYPLNYSNAAPAQDYYQREYLKPEGEKGKFFRKGGLLRQQPLPRAPVPENEPFRLTDIRHEIELAAVIGLDGFAVDILSLSGANWNQLNQLLDAAGEQYADFFILPMPDMNAELKRRPEAFIGLVEMLASKRSTYRLEDGRLVLAPYMAEVQTPQWWAQQKAELSRRGIEIALLPVFHNWRRGLARFKQALPTTYQDVLYGVSDWGPRTVSGARLLAKSAAELEHENLVWMAPVSPQDVRPKSSIYSEASNSSAYRTMWEGAIEHQADWVQIITWNDYSESTEIAPATRTGYAFYDLTAYYVQWFKQRQPSIQRDTLYAFYRIQQTDSDGSRKSRSSRFDTMKPGNGSVPENQVELLAMLQAPGELQIELNGEVHRMQAPAGMTSFKIPLVPGVPHFSLVRQGQTVIDMVGQWSILPSNEVDIPNLMYHGMGSNRLLHQQNQNAVSWPWRLPRFDREMALNASSKGSPFPRLSDQWPIQFADASRSANAGFGVSFLPMTLQEPVLITADIKLEGTVNAPAWLQLALPNAQGKPLTLAYLHDNSGACQSGKKGDASETDAIYLQSGGWYRTEWTVAREKFSDAMTVSAKITSANGKQQYARYSVPGTLPATFSGLMFGVGKIPADTGAVQIDNVSVSAGQ